ncbi:DNA mismatch repair protein MLH3 [Paragonimus heterotremus]|uniref:DNA mismatch repair protein MLH3 n=1 Tax=Paragonimus heterotremus TaxID=100268 RepID=A0A8J4ST40_9TREM|nr:DNA mismatch repair protein MLH3 [Paragonimus heterotremus]
MSYRHPKKFKLDNEKNTLLLTNKMLKRCSIIGYIDNNLILIKTVDMTGTKQNERLGCSIFAIDQHACHERILLEKLESHFETAIASLKNTSPTEIFPTTTVSLEINYPLSKNPSQRHSTKIRNTMARFGIHYKGSLSDTVSVFKVPALFATNGCIVSGAENSIRKFIRTILLYGTTDTNKLTTALKKIVRPFLQLRACRTAIRFGDPLDKSERRKLIDELSNCRLPFQCAHGRPTCALLAKLPKSD